MAGDSEWSNVKLLLHGDGLDGSTALVNSGPASRTITPSGNCQISTALGSAFGGMSIKFDGTSDYFRTDTSSDFNFNSGDWAIELRVHLVSLTSNPYVLQFWGGGTTQRFAVQVNNAGDVNLYIESGGAGGTYTTSGVTLATGQTYTIAVTRSGTTTRIFVDGVQRYSGTPSQAYPNVNCLVECGGAVSAAANWLDGYLEEVRITKGSARRTAGYTPDAAPFPDGMGQVSGTVKDASNAAAARLVRAYRRDTGELVAERYSNAADSDYNKVALLLHGDGVNGSTSFPDKSLAQRTITANGNAQVSTTQKKFGSASIKLDGNGDYLTASSIDFQFGTGDFTVEFWLFSAGSGDNVKQHVVQTRDGTNTGLTFEYHRTDGSMRVFFDGASTLDIISSNGAVPDATWKHVALTRSGTTVRLFVEGSQVASGTSSDNLNAGNLVIGRRFAADAGTWYYTNGYIEELRITKGLARYTANFTAPADRFSDRASGALGSYDFYTPTLDELTVMALDNAVSGTIYNDVVHRVIPA
jgi:hypothetical protein